MMIFLTVGLHEQPFDRLVKLVDELPGYDKVIQSGYSTWPVRAGTASPFMSFEKVAEEMKRADVVVTHGGTGCIMMSLSNGKMPIVAPRYARYGEHVDDHQVEIVRELAHRGLVAPFLDGDNIQDKIDMVKGKAGHTVSSDGVRRLDGLISQYLDG